MSVDSWLPLLDIFLNSPTPETEASLWLQQSFNGKASSSSMPVTPSSFIYLLAKPIDVIVADTNTKTNRVMYIQTLPSMVQSRILSFLALDCERFCKRDLISLAKNALRKSSGVDFWVKKAAGNLLDKMSERNYGSGSGLNLDSCEEFESLPVWLKEMGSNNELSLPWLPFSVDGLDLREPFDAYESDQSSSSQVPESGLNSLKEFVEQMEIDSFDDDTLDDETLNKAANLRQFLLSSKSTLKTVDLAKEIRMLCLRKGADSFRVLGLIEPWKADDETSLILIRHVLLKSEENPAWPSQVLASVILPKMLVLEEPASRLLLTAVVEFCKLHHGAAEYALLFPLLMRKGGINNPICDVITRIVKECLHPAHVSAFCNKLLDRGGEDEKRLIYLHCHQDLISEELVWTESLFNLFRHMLNVSNVHLTQSSVDQLVLQIGKHAQDLARSLKFGNFFLFLITKFALLLKPHKLSLQEAAGKTNTLVTKIVIAKLATL